MPRVDIAVLVSAALHRGATREGVVITMRLIAVLVSAAFIEAISPDWRPCPRAAVARWPAIRRRFSSDRHWH
ncbi:MAG TPA: hypothetical protein VG142_04845 [Trebonia sp.]|nr:hypothetical protein [Trebonia sp.]